MDVFAECISSNKSSHTLLSGRTFTLSSSFNNEQREKSTSAARALSIENSAEPKKKSRKGHRKSRTGCFTCKRVRIKVSSLQLKIFGERSWMPFSVKRIAPTATIAHIETSNASGRRFKASKTKLGQWYENRLLQQPQHQYHIYSTQMHLPSLCRISDYSITLFNVHIRTTRLATTLCGSMRFHV